MYRFQFSALFFFVFLFTTKAQTTLVLNAVRDNTIYQDAPGNSNGKGENLFSGSNALNSPRRALLKFDIAAQIPAGAVITSVTLTLFCNKTTAGNSDISIHQLLADWGESNSNAMGEEGGGIAAVANDATWVSSFHLSNLWNSPGGDFTATASATTTVGDTGLSYNWTSSQAIADVQNWLNNPSLNFGWILIGNETISSTSKRFDSRENLNSAQRPQLSVTYDIASVAASFTFTGSGNWNDASNWSNNNIPPATLPADAEIIIDPLSDGECVLNVPQTISTGGKLTVQANKKFRITGNLTIQ
ncbi:MAG: DNRLRE domain-containing protein [Ferruginibacter sp.]